VCSAQNASGPSVRIARSDHARNKPDKHAGSPQAFFNLASAGRVAIMKVVSATPMAANQGTIWTVVTTLSPDNVIDV
jgi:hypothetical protein